MNYVRLLTLLSKCGDECSNHWRTILQAKVLVKNEIQCRIVGCAAVRVDTGVAFCRVKEVVAHIIGGANRLDRFVLFCWRSIGMRKTHTSQPDRIDFHSCSAKFYVLSHCVSPFLSIFNDKRATKHLFNARSIRILGTLTCVHSANAVYLIFSK